METATVPAALDVIVEAATSSVAASKPSPSLPALPAAAELGLAVLGFSLLGLCAALGAESGSVARIAPSALIGGVGALGLTSPALLVGHQFLALEAPIGSLAASLGTAFKRTGGIALGLSPMVLFFSATSGLGSIMLGLAMCGMGIAGLTHAYAGLRACELAFGEDEGTARTVRDLKMQSLVVGWMGLTSLVGLRIVVHVMMGA